MAAATIPNGTATDQSLSQQIITEAREIKKYLEERASKPSGAASNRGRFIASFDQHGSDQWPTERLKSISDTYAPFVSRHEVDWWAKNQFGSSRISGIGGYLVKQAQMLLENWSGQSMEARNMLQEMKAQGSYTPNYGPEQFCKQFSTPDYQITPANAAVKKSWNGREITKAALAENSGQTGGYTVPPQFMSELLTIAAEDGFIEPKAKIVPMNTRTVQWPMLDITTVQALGTSPYFGGILAQWQPEAVSINETEPQFRQTDWTAWDLVLYTVSSNQLLADNGIGLDALLTQLFGQAITWYKEFAYLQGLGSGATMPLGILNAPAALVQSRNTANKFFLQDAAAMLSHLQIRSWKDAMWIMHQSVVPQLIQMVDHVTSGVADTGAHLVWLNPFPGGNIEGPSAQKLPQAFLNGMPLYFTEKLPQLGVKGDVMLVDWSRYVIGMRLDLQIDVSPHFLFRNNQLAWRVIARLDAKPWLNSFVTDQAGWQVSPFVVLK